MKKCFKCGILKPIDEFYKHSKMLDGHLNKCKDCSKIDTKQRSNMLLSNLEWVEAERDRHREKYHRLGYRELHKPTFEGKKKSIESYVSKYPEKLLVKNSSQNIKANTGCQMHHWSYNLEHAKDVIELSIEDHFKLHRFIAYDQQSYMYRRKDTMELLDSKEKHLAFYRSISSLAYQSVSNYLHL